MGGRKEVWGGGKEGEREEEGVNGLNTCKSWPPSSDRHAPPSGRHNPQQCQQSANKQTIRGGA